MKLSTRGRFGTRALLDIAINFQEDPVPLREIAQRQQISLSYLEHLIAPLIKGGLIKSTRGVGGGVSLTKSPDKIKLNEVIGLLEGSLDLVKCVNDPTICNRSEFCVTRDIWNEMKEAMDSVLCSTTLQDLIDRQQEKGQPMYYI